MQKLTIIFGKGTSIFSRLIRVLTWSRWSHVGIVDGDSVIEATAKDGVVENTLDSFKERYEDYQLAYLLVEDRNLVLTRARMELGKPYDYMAIFGILLRSGWQNPKHWFCSEHLANSTNQFRVARVSRITPEDVWKISKDVQENT